MKFKFNSKIAFLILTFLVTITSSAQCNEPSGIIVDNIDAVSATLTWTASTSAPGIGYSFEVRTSGAPGSGVSGLIDSGSTVDGVLTSQITGLLSDTNYSVYMNYQCTAAPLFSSWTTEITFTTSVLSAPDAGAPAGLSDTFFSARWIAVLGATGYRLDVSEFSDFSVMLPSYDNLFVSGSSTSRLVSGLDPSTNYYYRVRAEGISGGGPVTSANSNIIMVTTFDEPTFVAVWSNGAWLNDIYPTEDHDVILDDNFISDENNEYMFEVKSITLNEGYTYTLTSGYNLIVHENIINNSTPSSFVVQNNANLSQLNDEAAANEGQITVKRNSSEIFRLDYTMWSSPVTGTQTLKQFSPQTVDGRFYEYDTANDIYSPINPLTTTFEPGNGYFIRAANNYVANNGTNSPQIWEGTFVGVPTNGEVTIDLNTGGEGFNMVGNPYPTVINANAFMLANSSNIEQTLYFWRRLNDSTGEGETGSFYATYNETGGTGTPTSDDPNGFIQVGQGFLVKALSTELTFNSDMKTPDEFENQFFRYNTPTQIEKHRMWLNLTNENGIFSRMLVGYVEGATNDKDRFDGRYINDSEVALTSLINNEEYAIQARSLPFSVEDTIQLGFKVVTAGEYTISLSKMDGLFEAGQLVYLEDTFTTTIHNLSAADYTFSAESGDFKNRFVLRFTNETMSIDQPLNANAVAVFVKDNSININTGNVQMNSVAVFDVQGRKLLSQDQVNSSEFIINTLAKNNQVLILQIRDENNNIVNKKIIF
ncbi:T9SS sorting signal type C domain-containing protein [Flavobacterium azooxidireducens]|uniref:T9SS sorting signal type C domain-containing protein n=1 Tax=Flavobacterium azooxidireducens TaxID=1871076 RepID=A0ABY4KGJ3_9FLAO|nr:T9SS sorting signal type C domain-containing protein [Flavobacterium azooxidireducens]UPQ79679.1 T9SS sorting signal type C domain-containing protein [Flavobacterium azooxidireducens]